MNKESKKLNKGLVFLISLSISIIFYVIVSPDGNTNKSTFSLISDTSGVYVMENIEIEYIYDKTKYEVIPFVNEPYAVIKGENHLLNVLKWKGKPKFYIDLSGKSPGSYTEKVKYEGIYSSLDVQVYPTNVELKFSEQQTIKVEPILEIINEDKLGENLLLAMVEPLKKEVLIRDTQDNLAKVASVKGVIDVKNMTKSKEIIIDLKVYDYEGNEMQVNLLDKQIPVLVPIEQKVTIIKEEIVKEIVIIQEPNNHSNNHSNNDSSANNNYDEKPNSTKQDTSKEDKDIIENSNTKQNNDTIKDNPNLKTYNGKVSFINIDENLEVINNSLDLKWTKDIQIDVKTFKEGIYELDILDDGEKKQLKFEIVLKESTDASNEDSNNEDSNNEDSNNEDSNNEDEETPILSEQSTTISNTNYKLKSKSKFKSS